MAKHMRNTAIPSIVDASEALYTPIVCARVQEAASPLHGKSAPHISVSDQKRSEKQKSSTALKNHFQETWSRSIGRS
jgi:hypothetical protein